MKVAIIGGGLSGLCAAYRLEQKGVRDLVLIEARTRLGGRILSVAPTKASSEQRFDLGPSWFWPDFQPQFAALVAELGLSTYPQYEQGDMLLEKSADVPPERIPGYPQVPTSMRIKGGMQALVDALQERLEHTNIVTDQTVNRLSLNANIIRIDTHNAQGESGGWQADQVLLAIPPRLACASISFEPSLPDALARQWRGTATWMAPHAKYVAVYASPFWREQRLSGDARSAAGPMGEIHDASLPDGSAALFGFIGVSARVRKNIPPQQLRALCRAQFGRLFGAAAADPLEDIFQDWAFDPLTTTEHDMEGILEHPFAPAASANTGAWMNRLIGIAGEFSPHFPGYVAGAVEAAERAIAFLHDGQQQAAGG